MTESNRRSDPLSPSTALLCKLGSIIVHAQEGLSDSGHIADIDAFFNLLGESEVQTWIAEMEKLALPPVKR